MHLLNFQVSLSAILGKSNKFFPNKLFDLSRKTNEIRLSSTKWKKLSQLNQKRTLTNPFFLKRAR